MAKPVSETTRPIKIKPAHNGYIVTVGCKTVLFTSRKKLVKELARYLANPEKVERKYTEAATVEAPWANESCRTYYVHGAANSNISIGAYSNPFATLQEALDKTMNEEVNDDNTN